MEKTNEASGAIKTSIIMPCYNCAKFMGDTVKCLEEQTCKDFEVVCINDGSTDNTLEFLTDWQKKSSLKIKIIDQPNGGVSRARNRGLKEAEGEYIVFLDSDDIFNKDYIALMVGTAEERGVDTVYCKLDRNLTKVGDGDFSAALPVEKTLSEAMNDLMYKMGDIGFCCYVYRRNILCENDIEFDVDTKHGEDREFNWKYLCKCASVMLVDVPLYGYRIILGSATHKKIEWDRVVKGLAWVERVDFYMEECGCEFLPEFREYLYARVMWAYAKSISLDKNKELFNRLLKEYDVKKCMKQTKRAKDRLVALTSRVFLVSPKLFYLGMAMLATLKGRK